MIPVFADTLYWIGLANPRDQWHQLVLKAKRQLAGRHVVTTDEVLTEFASALASSQYLRLAACKLIDAIRVNPQVTVVAQSRETFLAGLDLYRDRPDKEYSLGDCISMNACRAHGIAEVLTNDHHFEQEGFTILIKR